MLTVHAYIEVTDLARGIEFYCDGLGLTEKRQLGPRWVELAGANMSIFLLSDRPATTEVGATEVSRDFGRHWTPVHLDFIVTDLDGMLARLCGPDRKIIRLRDKRGIYLFLIEITATTKYLAAPTADPVILARMRIFDWVLGPEPESPADRQRER